MFDIETPTTACEFTAERAQAIYGEFKSKGINLNNAHGLYTQKDGDHKMCEILKTVEEVKKIKAEITSKINGGYVVSPAETDEDGNITKEEVRFKVTTQQALADSVENDFLDVTELLADFIIFDDGNYDADRTFEEFIQLFSNEI